MPQSLTIYTHGLSVPITALVKHWCLGKLQVYMFCRKVVGIHEQYLKKNFVLMLEKF